MSSARVFGRRQIGVTAETTSDGGVRSFRVLAFLVWAACTLPTTVLLLRADRVFGETIPYTPTTQALRYALIIAVLSWAVFIINRRIVTLLTRPFGAVIILSIALFYPAMSGYFRSDGTLDELSTALVSLIIVLALFSLRVAVQDLSVVGVLGAVTGALSLGMAWFRPQSAFVWESGGQALAGPFGNSNFLGTVLVLSLPFALLIRRRVYRVVSIVLIVWPILIGGSDTGIVTLGVFIVIGSITLILKSPSFRSTLFGFANGIALLAMMLLPFLVVAPDALTGRGSIWMHARRNMLDFIPFGAGSGWYETNAPSVGFSMSHGHHLLLDPLIVGGLPYFGAVLVLLITLIRFGVRVAYRGGSTAPTMYTLILVLAGGVGNFFILDLRDLRYMATGFVIVTLLSIATRADDQVSTKRTRRA